jgi:hypothetical protein
MADEGGEAKNAGAESHAPAKPSLMMKIGCPECKNPDPDVIEGRFLYVVRTGHWKYHASCVGHLVSNVVN